MEYCHGNDDWSALCNAIDSVNNLLMWFSITGCQVLLRETGSGGRSREERSPRWADDESNG